MKKAWLKMSAFALLWNMEYGNEKESIPTWCRVYSLPEGGGAGYSVVETHPQSYVVVGYVNNGRDAIILKLDRMGKIVFHKVYDFGYDYERFYRVKFFPADNTFFVAGTAGPLHGERYAILMKVDTLFNTIWWVGEKVAGPWGCCGNNYYTDQFFDIAFSNENFPRSKIIAVGGGESCDCNESEGKVSIYNFDGTPVFRGLYILPSSASAPNSAFTSLLRITSNKFFAFGGSDWPSDSRVKILSFDTLGKYTGEEK